MNVTDRPSIRSAQLTGDLIGRLRRLLGDRLHLSDAMRAQHGQSETHFQAALPDAVAFPCSTEEIVKLVNLCVEANVPVVPFGAGTSLEGNAIPVRGGLSVNLSGMNEIIEVNPEDQDCTVQAGVRRENLNEYLRDKGLFFPVDPGANATIGGMAATRASGTNAVRYGTMRDSVLALRVVMPDGREIWTSKRARKSAAGYDLTSLMIGSEGTLGIITEVTLKLQGIPEVISSAVCGFATLEGAVNTVVQAIQMGVPIARAEILDEVQMMAVNRWSQLSYPEIPTLFFEFHGTSSHVNEQIGTVREIAAANGGGSFKWSNLPEERSNLWKARHNAYYAAVNLRPGAAGWVTDVCVPMSRLTECISLTKRDLASSTIPATILGHVGDGNFHVIFAIDPRNSDEFAEVASINRRLIERALGMDGTCTGEHGVGLGKKDWLVAELGEAVDYMIAIKNVLDPKGLFNPGKIFELH